MYNTELPPKYSTLIQCDNKYYSVGRIVGICCVRTHPKVFYSIKKINGPLKDHLVEKQLPITAYQSHRNTDTFYTELLDAFPAIK